MFPVIASIAGFTISSFGLFLLLAFIAAFFVVWRIIRLYDIDPERMIDLTLFTFVCSLIGARLYFIVSHLSQINNINRAIDIYRFPGFSFWGGLTAGIISLFFLSRRLKLRLWQVADIAIVGLFIALSIGSIGCLLGSCEYGVNSSLPIAVTQVGVIGKRLPVQLFESILMIGLFWYFWRSILKFHFDGQITGWGLIVLGVTKAVIEPFRPAQLYILTINISYLFCGLLLLLGVWILYSRPKKSLKQDLAYSVTLIRHQPKRKQALSSIRKWWYNLYVTAGLNIARLKRNLFKLLHVKANPDKF